PARCRAEPLQRGVKAAEHTCVMVVLDRQSTARLPSERSLKDKTSLPAAPKQCKRQCRPQNLAWRLVAVKKSEYCSALRNNVPPRPVPGQRATQGAGTPAHQ